METTDSIIMKRIWTQSLLVEFYPEQWVYIPSTMDNLVEFLILIGFIAQFQILKNQFHKNDQRRTTLRGVSVLGFTSLLSWMFPNLITYYAFYGSFGCLCYITLRTIGYQNSFKIEIFILVAFLFGLFDSRICFYTTVLQYVLLIVRLVQRIQASFVHSIVGIALTIYLLLIFFGTIKSTILFYLLNAGVHIFVVFLSGRKEWLHYYDMVEDVE